MKNSITETQKMIGSTIAFIEKQAEEFNKNKKKINQIMDYFEDQEEMMFEESEEIFLDWLRKIINEFDFSNENKYFHKITDKDILAMADVPTMYIYPWCNNRLEALLEKHFTGKILANLKKHKSGYLYIVFTFNG